MKAPAAGIVALLVLIGCSQPAPKDIPGPKPPSAEPVASSARDRAKIHTELGVSYYESGRLAVALEELNEAIKIDRTYAPAWNARGLVNMDLKEDARAESDFKQGLRLDPNSSDIKNNYGLFLCQRNRGKEGIRYFLEAVKNPLYATPDVAYKNAGLCARNIGESKGAEQYFMRAVQINPAQPQALFNLADMAYGRGDAVAAKGYLDRYMRAAPNTGPEELWLGAKVAYVLGDRAATMNYGNQLRRRYPAAPETKAFMEGRFR
jgi:type IV pilus assembly protein PilF